MKISKEIRRQVFEAASENFETERIKAYFLDMSEEVPDYFFEIPASTSGKYHNAQQCAFCGLLVHAYMISAWIDMMLPLESIKGKYTPEQRDLMRCFGLLHDSVKCGWNGSQYTVQDHPMLSAELVRTKHPAHNLKYDEREFLAGLCAAHSGEWNKSRSGQEIMPKPENDAERMCHYADMTCSRKAFSYELSDAQKAAIAAVCDLLNRPVQAEINPPVQPVADPGLVRMPFGKYAGQTLGEIVSTATGKDYLRWAVDNIQRKPDLVQAMKALL